MKCKTADSKHMDAYEAGLELGEALAPINPEVVLLFPSIHYESYEELFQGIQDALDDNNVIVFGGTGDGYYVDTESNSVGVGAMGLNGEGKVRWDLVIGGEGTCADPKGAATACAKELLRKAGGMPDLTFSLVPMACDGTRYVSGLRDIITTPCIGALVGDDRKFKTGMVLVNGEVYVDQSVLLGLSGSFNFATNLASGWLPMGEKTPVTEAEGSALNRIGDDTALEFITRQYGKNRVPSTIGNLAFYPDADSDTHFIRTVYKHDKDTGSVTCFGSIEIGNLVRACGASRDQILEGAQEAVAGLGPLDFTPTGALLVSCAGRKWALGERTVEELLPLKNLAESGVPVLGIPSFGEIGPHRNPDDGEYGPSYFHNTTYVLTVFG